MASKFLFADHRPLVLNWDKSEETRLDHEKRHA